MITVDTKRRVPGQDEIVSSDEMRHLLGRPPGPDDYQVEFVCEDHPHDGPDSDAGPALTIIELKRTDYVDESGTLVSCWKRVR